jgi:serine/threonine-protein kinase
MGAEPFEALDASLAVRYRIERELGEGGMATVYLAEDVRHGRKVAIKVIRPEIAAALGTDRFLAEIKLTASLQHPHILGLIDSGVIPSAETGSRLFYVMPYVDGETLRARLAREGTVPIGEAVSILAEVADALACAHGRGIIHRDIKPENILLGQGHAMVADFGIAKALDRSSAGGRLTSTGVSVGTPAYMAPEQAVGDPNVDHRADLYALGIVAYELLAGRTPFAGPDMVGMVTAALTRPAPSLSASAPTCPPRLVALVGALLEKDPAERPQSAASVRDTLRSILAEISTSAPVVRPPRPSRRVTIGIGAGIGLVLLVGLVVWNRRRTELPASTLASATSRLPRSIAVLPFDNLNRDSATNYFSDGVTEELISALGRVAGLRVASRTSSFAIQGRNVDLADVGRRLRVGAILEGSVQREADQVRVNVRLVDVARDSVLWDGKYNGSLRNVLFLQDSIAREIVAALSGALTGDASVVLARPRTRDPRAHESYLLGLHFRRQRKVGSMTMAIKSFKDAVARDSLFAPAYAGLAEAYILAAPFESRPPREVFPLARQAAQRALALDPALAEAHTSLGMIAMFYDWNWREAGQHLKRGIELNPSYAEGHLFYAWYKLFRGELASADSEMAVAHESDPLSAVIATRRASVLSYQGRHAEAIQYFRRALELDSTFVFARMGLAVAFIRTGENDSARRVVPRKELRPGTGESAHPSWVLVQLGDSAAARDELRALEDADRRGYVSADGLAAVYAVLGDTARALEALRRAEDDRAFSLAWLPRYPMFDSIRRTSRYRSLIRRVGVVETP